MKILCKKCKREYEIGTDIKLLGEHKIKPNNKSYAYFKCKECDAICACCEDNVGLGDYHVYNILKDISSEPFSIDVGCNNYTGWNDNIFYKGYSIDFSHDRDTWADEITVSDMSKQSNFIFHEYALNNGETKETLFKKAIETIDKKILEKENK